MRNTQVVPEPVEKWQNVDGKWENMLKAFYDDPQGNAYIFQNYVFVTRVLQARHSPLSWMRHSEAFRKPCILH